MVKKKKQQYKSMPFDICIEIAATKERFILKHVFAEMKVKSLKAQIELVVGIPSHLHRLQYLDEGDMLDGSSLKHNDIVAGGTLNLRLWRIWEDLVKAVCTGTFNDLMLTGGLKVDESLKESNPSMYQYKVDIVKDRVSTAAFIAAHRGNQDMVKQLIQLGADLNYKTPFGRTCLHTAASQGHSLCIDLMLASGASMTEGDFEGRTALNVANQFGFKDTERHLFLFQWQTRAAKTKPRKTSSKLMMHQQFDSGYPIWLTGRHGQLYYATTLPPGEFGGTGIGAPRTSDLSEDKVTQESPPSPVLPRIDGVPQSQYENYPEHPWWEKGGPSYDKFARGPASNMPEQDQKKLGDGSRFSLGGAYINPKLAKQRERERVQSGKSMKSTSSKSSRSPKTYQEWVTEKEALKQKEMMKMAQIKQEEFERRKKGEEQESLKERTYDEWKKQKERKDKEEKERQTRLKAIEERRKQQQQQKSEFSYDEWLGKKDEEFMRDIMAK